jgi:hypothetical protein
MKRTRKVFFSGVALSLAWVLLAWAADDAGAPADLEMIPADAAVVVSFRPADMWAHDLVKPLRDKLGKDAAVMVAEVSKHLGTPPEEIERLTLVMPTLMAEEPVVLVSVGKPYDRTRVAAVAGKEAKEETFKGRTLFVSPPRQSSVCLLGPRAYAIGNGDAIRSLIEQAAARRDGPLAEARRLAGEKHTLVAGLNVPTLAAVLLPQLPGEAEPLQPLFEAKSATLVADLDTEARASLRLPFAGAAQAKKGAAALREGVKMTRDALAEGKKHLAEQPDGAAMMKLIDQVAGLLKDVAVEQDGATVRACGPPAGRRSTPWPSCRSSSRRSRSSAAPPCACRASTTSNRSPCPSTTTRTPTGPSRRMPAWARTASRS